VLMVTAISVSVKIFNSWYQLLGQRWFGDWWFGFQAVSLQET